ncbi:deoxynucleoside triphosphate triphosphohydrolase SAMHD1-like [Portunus trituberculatus]|uniref:deoxynucleoside triphosphate triphosphohydrolase SAMHD1-like n=1 Tax=Portunus trituberculatus TaxID=210409 RepID=UPI001E1D1317|nr:deoxynucleoside triphosphate triphosphohydrolase SAMHD1-like [Portunus trituberculatus]
MEKISHLEDSQEPKVKKLKKETKVFQDAVHGTIAIPYACKVVVDTQEFQRLRGLRQLGMAYMVYPSANHTRFEHSLGACHLAGLLAASLKEKQQELCLDDKDVLCVQLAGLCHDLGHGPLGHFWEPFASKTLQKRWKHEEMSVRMLDHLWKKNDLKDSLRELNDDDLAFIKAMIHPKGCPLPEKYRSKKFLLQIVANEETGIDVDKWDYFLRDSLHLGIKVTFDPKRFIEYSRVIEKNGEKIICFRDKMYREVLELFQTRYVLHCKAYRHKVLDCIDLMVNDALHAEIHSNEDYRKPGTAVAGDRSLT